MKAIDRETLIKASREGKADKREMRHAILSPESDDLDERDAMERVADELEKLSKVVMAATEEQATRISNLIAMLAKAIERISDQKIEVKSSPVQIDLSDGRPTEWMAQVQARDKSGRIDKVKFYSDRTVH